MNKSHYRIAFHAQFLKWLANESAHSQAQIGNRLKRINLHDHFGDHKCIDPEKGIYELRWKNGRRIYFVHRAHKIILVLLGGNKNGQKQDIKKAKILVQSC